MEQDPEDPNIEYFVLRDKNKGGLEEEKGRRGKNKIFDHIQKDIETKNNNAKANKGNDNDAVSCVKR